jgi:uncharacterized phage-associated protein
MLTKEWALLVVAAGRGLPLTPVQLQKALFLLGRNLNEEQLRTAKFYSFRAYDYGPFNQQIYSDAEQLRAVGLITITPFAGSPNRDYSATPAGLDRARILREVLGPEVTSYLDRVVEWVRSLSFTALVRAIYRDYPEMKENSVFRD